MVGFVFYGLISVGIVVVDGIVVDIGVIVGVVGVVLVVVGFGLMLYIGIIVLNKLNDVIYKVNGK